MLRDLLNEPDVDLEALESNNAIAEAGKGDNHVDEMAIRQLMIEDAKIDVEVDRVKRTRDAVAATYNDRLTALEARRARARTLLQAWLERQPEGRQKIRFADVGTAYLAKGDPKVEVADRDALPLRARTTSSRSRRSTRPPRRATRSRRRSTARPIPAGVNVVPGGPRLQIKRA
jgi:hypothetical protein